MNPEDVRKRIRAHMVAFAVILALAMLAAGTVMAGSATPAAVMSIAAVQALVVLFAMMHAGNEGPWVRWLLVFCAFFVALLGSITYHAYQDTIHGTEHVVIAPAEAAESGEGH